MTETIFLISMSTSLLLLFWWSFRHLTDEKWQVMASVPLFKEEGGLWAGLNLTWYGFFIANSCLFATAIYLLLMASLSIPVAASIALAVAILGVSAPATRIMARLVEGKKFTSTIGGGSFVGILGAPLIIFLAGIFFPWPLPFFPVMAAIMISYALGEGSGRIACISFGCCYGRPLSDFSPRIQSKLARWSFVFTGKNKKIAYESSLDGQRVIPVQAYSSIINSLAGIVGLILFLASQFAYAYFVTSIVTQGWRFFSEFLRSDFRGYSRISAYQKMNIILILNVVILTVVVPSPPAINVDLAFGLRTMWDPAIILFLQILWIVFFLFTGRSKVTGAKIHYFVHGDRI